MKRKPNKPKQEARERPGSWESAADPGGAAKLSLQEKHEDRHHCIEAKAFT